MTTVATIANLSATCDSISNRVQVEWLDQKDSKEKEGYLESEDRKELLVTRVHR